MSNHSNIPILPWFFKQKARFKYTILNIQMCVNCKYADLGETTTNGPLFLLLVISPDHSGQQVLRHWDASCPSQDGSLPEHIPSLKLTVSTWKFMRNWNRRSFPFGADAYFQEANCEFPGGKISLWSPGSPMHFKDSPAARPWNLTFPQGPVSENQPFRDINCLYNFGGCNCKVQRFNASPSLASNLLTNCTPRIVWNYK